MPVKESQKSKVLLLLLLNFVCVLGRDAAFCFKQETHYNTTLKGGLDAGEYTPWEPRGVDFMTVDLCTKHCCKSPDTDAVFLLNSHCFCVKCYSVRSCSLQKITPPPGYIPVTVIVMESISKFSTTSTPHTHPKTFRDIPKTETSSQSTAVRLNQKQTEQGTERHSHVKTTPTQTTSYGGPGRGNGEDHEVNITSPNISSTGATTPRPTRKVTKQKKAEGMGNDDISLLCPGSLKVTGVRAFEVSGNTDTIKDFDKYCQANLVRVDASNVMCILSLRRVYKSRYPPFVKTAVTYECSYTEFVS
ncbi:uncharacterized protein LOC114955923 [Acropora millepora]|uniref:uncharacterized protein LOC114955923 n=1 Tax=Acropora millepora TaxID=45264 RepID=UPI001CF35640|nr:uncharacterized protein LOC114955923 [Acropora millepora]